MKMADARWLISAFVCVCPAVAVAQNGEPRGEAERSASAAPLDQGIRRMIEAAMAEGDEATVASVLSVARLAAPESRDEIDERERAWRAQLAARQAQARERRLAELRASGPLDNWKGEVEAGASRATGNAPNFGLLGSITLKREGAAWTHELSARGEVQSTNGETTTERLFAAWQPNYRFDDKAYAYGLAQYERDPFAGYDSRVTLGGGLGYRPLSGERLKLKIEGGPALRRVHEVDGSVGSRLAARGSLDFAWRITPTLGFTQKTAVFIEGGDGNIIANTGLDTKLIGNLKARFSYNIQYERNPPAGTAELNTQTRATFVYGF